MTDHLMHSTPHSKLAATARIAPGNAPNPVAPSGPHPARTPARPMTAPIQSGTLRIPEQMARALSDAASRAEDTAENIRQRSDHRRAMPETVRVIAQVDQLGGTSQTQVATVRDFSAGGLAMLWGNFLHPGTRCAFTVVASETHEPLVHATAQVVRCSHLKGSIHDVGVKFDEPIDLQRIPGASTEAHQAAASLEELAKDLLAAVQAKAETRRIESILARFSEDLRTARGMKRPAPGALPPSVRKTA